MPCMDLSDIDMAFHRGQMGMLATEDQYIQAVEVQ